MKFTDIIGQKDVIKALKNSIRNNKVSHAYIFEGEEGIGKKTVASAFATVLSCENIKDYTNNATNKIKGNIDACGQCNSCIKAIRNNHSDIKFIESEKQSIGVDLIREVKKDLYIKPYQSTKKIYIITKAEKLTMQAQNALLDILEDPPNYGVIILNTINPSLLLQTILSRGIIIKFKKHPYIEVETFLKEQYPNQKDNIHFLTMYSGGNIGKAIEFSQSKEIMKSREETIHLFTKMIKNSEIYAINLTNYFNENKNAINYLLNFIFLWLRDILIMKKTQKDDIIINIDMKDMIKIQSKELSARAICNMMDIIINTQKRLDINSNYSLTIETMLIQCWEEINGRDNRCAI